jgi:hypothetical protein
VVGRFGRRYRAGRRCRQGLQRHDLQHAGQLPGDGRHPQKLYAAGKGNLADASRIGSVYHMRGVSAGILWVEAIRTAQEKFGKGKRVTGEQMRWGLENLNVDEARLKAIGAFGMLPT